RPRPATGGDWNGPRRDASDGANEREGVTDPERASDGDRRLRDSARFTGHRTQRPPGPSVRGGRFRMEQKKVTVPDILRMKPAGERITMVTAYDCPFARLLDEAGVDILLVGDSLGMVVQGQDTTLPVTLDEMVYHTRMVARGRQRALVLGDLPFGSYQASPRRAVESAVRLVKEGGAEAVKLEGGTAMARTIEAIAAIDVPVVGPAGEYVAEVKGGRFPTEAQAFAPRAAKAG